MADLFDEVVLTWDGEQYRLTPNLEHVGRVENVITLTALMKSMQEVNPPFVKVSRAYGILLRAAGASVTDEEIYAAMFGDGETQSAAFAAISALLAMMIPKSVVEKSSKKRQGQMPEAMEGTES